MTDYKKMWIELKEVIESMDVDNCRACNYCWSLDDAKKTIEKIEKKFSK
jgi:hypothetical protein